MVVERDLPVHIWGMAAPGEAVSVSFRGETRTAKASELGRWSVYLKPGEAGGPFQITIQGALAAQTITLDDVLVGDVWLASGQSNMEFRMYQAATAAADLPHAANPRIRLLMVERNAAEYAQDDIQPGAAGRDDEAAGPLHRRKAPMISRPWPGTLRARSSSGKRCLWGSSTRPWAGRWSNHGRGCGLWARTHRLRPLLFRGAA